MQTQGLYSNWAGPVRRMRFLVLLATMLSVGLGGVWSTATADAAPALTFSSSKFPTSFRVGDTYDQYDVYATNSGDAMPAGTPATVEVRLPAGVSVRQVIGGYFYDAEVPCSADGESVSCTSSAGLGAGQTIALSLVLSAGDGAVGGAEATITVSGGGQAVPAVYQDPLSILPRQSFGTDDFFAGTIDEAGVPDVTAPAGGHPFAASANFTVNNVVTNQNTRYPVETVKDVITDLPVGFVGNPQTVPTCTQAQLAAGTCPIESQVGVIRVGLYNQVDPPPASPYGVYNMVPDRGHVAQFGATIINYGFVHIYASVRSDDNYGIRLKVSDSPSEDPLPLSVGVSLWGTPADPRHDAERFTCPFPGFCFPGASSSAPETAFLSNPHECLPDPPVTELLLDSWQHPGDYKRFRSVAAPLTDCDKPEFEPTVAVKPSGSAPDAPTGLNVDLAFPQEGLTDPDGLAPPPLKKATVTLPEGMTINPSGANGLKACTDDELKLKSKDPVTCPNEAKVGTATATSPVLAEQLTGGVYIRSQNSDDPESGEMFRIALVLENEERGLSIRLPGSIRANKDTGRLETTFDNNPQLPVSNINLHFKDGPRAPLASPPTCGEKTVDTQLTSWGGHTVNRKNSFTVDCVPNLGGFSPTFKAGVVNPIAGAASPFTLGIGKPDGNADLNGLRLEMPEGLLATIKGNLGTRIGTATVGAGPGSQPFWLHGPVVLEGAYGDAPYSLRVTVPAKAGPFDLGDVVVRQKIYVDPHDAHVTIVSDPLPTIVKGVPVRLQNLNVAVDKPGFMRNPTSCAEKTISGTLGAAGGQTAAVSSRFQVGGCKDLPLKPQLELEMPDKRATTQGKTTPFSATVRQTSDQTALKKVVVTLPPTLSLMAENAQALCKPAEAAAKNCPAGSIVGKASATTPLLDEALTGNVYFVEGLRTTATGKTAKTFPKLWVALRGPIALDLWADTDVKNNRLINTFGFVPDAPISSFKLDIAGGKYGILAVASNDNKADVCKGEQIADAVFDGQNGKQVTMRPRVITPCGFGIVSQRFYSTKVKVRVGGIGSGKLTVSGNGIRKTTRTITSSRVATVTAKLTASGKRSYKGRKALKLRATFTPAGAGAKPTTRTVTLKRAAAKKAKKAAAKR